MASSPLQRAQSRLKHRVIDVRRERRELREARERLAKTRRVVERHQAKPTGALEVVRQAKMCLGVVEDPGRPNRGRQVDAWQLMFATVTGYAWCGAFVGAMLRKVGVPVTNRIIYTPYILEDARRGVGGFTRLVAFAEAKPGDVILFNFPGGAGVDHVGIVTGFPQGDSIETVEGNTSSSNAGSQSNGGGVFARVRSRSQVAGIARPAYKT